MRKATSLAILILIALSPVMAESGRISVSGTATITARPDIATISITASALGETSDEARSMASSMINEASSILESEFSISAEDISTTMISAYPEYRWYEGENKLIGQRAIETISVKIRNLDILGDIYTRLLAINGLEISDAVLDKEDKSEETELSRINAVLDARKKAETYAKAAGTEIGDVISITDSSSSSVISPRANMLLASAAMDESQAMKTEYRISDITISSTVSIVYELIND